MGLTIARLSRVGELIMERRAPSAERRAPSAERRAPSAERRAPSAERHDCASGAGAGRPAIVAGPPAAPPGRRLLTFYICRIRRRPAGGSRAYVARRGLVRCARALAAAALLALTGALFLPPTAEAQTATTLVSNTGQPRYVDTIDYGLGAFSQRFTTGSNEAGYTLTGVDVVSASSTGFTAQVCGVDSDLKFPTSTCTDLTPPVPFAVGTMSFTAPTNTALVKETTYAVVVTALATNTPGPAIRGPA